MTCSICFKPTDGCGHCFGCAKLASKCDCLTKTQESQS